MGIVFIYLWLLPPNYIYVSQLFLNLSDNYNQFILETVDFFKWTNSRIALILCIKLFFVFKSKLFQTI